MAPREQQPSDAQHELREQSTGDLVKQLTQQVSTLVRQEMRLAQAELQEKGKRAGLGAGMFGGAGVVALYGVGALIAAAIMVLGTALEPWLAAVIGGVVVLLVAAVLTLIGKSKVKQAAPAKPEQALESVQRDIDEVKARARNDRR